MTPRVTIAVLSLAAMAAAAGPSAEAPPLPANVVVLELFTSQGCSSCPPADAVLRRLGLGETTRASVVPLAFHVDYWDRMGWKDPFSAAAWSARQDAYNRALGGDGAYTPQLVVNGRTHLNGSREERARAEIAADLQRPPVARLGLAVRDAAEIQPALAVDVGAEITGAVEAGRLQMMVALFESSLETAVGRGENAGRTLRNDFIVRRLEKAFSIEPKVGARGQRVLTLGLQTSWRRENLGVAAFLQDPGSMRIHGATVQPAH